MALKGFTNESFKAFVDEIKKYASDGSHHKHSWNDLDDKPFYSETVVTEILPETQAVALDPSGDGETDMYGVTQQIEFEVGKKYLVTWNGVEYPSVCISMNGETGIVNEGTDMTTGEGAVFAIADMSSSPMEVDGQTFYTMVGPMDGSADITLSISAKSEIVHALDSKYLNEALHFGSKFVTVLEETKFTVSEDASEVFITTPFSLTTGQEYVVNWNGTEYPLIAVDVDTGYFVMAVLGNIGAMMGGADTGEPFIIAALPEDLPEAAPEGVYGQIMPLDGSAEFTVSIAGEEVDTIDPKYLPEHLQFGPTKNGEPIEIYPETVLDGMYLPDTVVFESGKTYSVMLNGTEYICVAQDHTEDGISAVVLGNVGVLDDSGDNGMPFLIIYAPNVFAADGGAGIGSVIQMSEDVGDTLTIAVYALSGVKPLDSKYLEPFTVKEATPEMELLSETQVEISGQTPLEAAFALVPGNDYVVTWDGTEYEQTAGEVMSLYPYVGNSGLLLETEADTGEPFLIVVAPDGVMVFGTDGTHTVEVKAKATPRVVKLKAECLPESLVLEETDPTVPAWAKEATKPSYTAGEVGAAPANHTHDEYAPANHTHDEYATEEFVTTAINNIEIPDGNFPVTSVNNQTGAVVLKITDLENDAGFVTESFVNSAANQIKDDLLNGAGDAYDTLKELGDLIDENKDAVDALEEVAAGKADKDHSHTASEVGAAPTNHTHDEYLTSFAETDPTVPAWAKEATKPSYTAGEVGAAPVDHTHPIIDNTTGVNYELSVDNGILSHDIAGSYTEFSITSSNRADINYTDETTDLVIPSAFIKDGKTYKVTSIGNSAFNSRTSLTSITIPDSVTSIGSYAFHGCTNLTSITIPDSVTTIEFYAFNGCTSLTSITIPDSVTSIGKTAFNGCTSLTSITIPDSITSIESNAFKGCTNLISITIPDSVTSIGSYAFNGCASLTSITIPDSVTSIESNAFNGCTSLTSITIPDSVTSIGSYAFYGCTSLTSITIPDSVTSIGETAFYSCTNLAIVYFNGTEEEWNSITIGSYNSNLTNANIIHNYTGEKQDKLAGVTGQLVGFDNNGNAVAVDKSTYTAEDVGAAPANHTHDEYAPIESPTFTTSISMGRKSDADIGTGSTALGGDVEASGYYSHAEGIQTIASGLFSHAEGAMTIASGSSSHAEGHETIASGEYSHAEGYNTVASSSYQHAQGKYNIEKNNYYLHIVGNGTSTEVDGETVVARSNAHTLDLTGTAWFAGDVYVGSTSGTDKDAGSKKLATEEYVDSTVPEWAKQETKPVYTASEVGAALADHTHDEYLTSFTETDPTVPSWAKQETKPVYTASEVGAADVEYVDTEVLKKLDITTIESGTTWTASTLPSSANWYSVTYGDGKFVAVSSKSNKAAYSTDGINWIASTLPSSAVWTSVTYGDGKFVAVASGYNTTAYSTDGITWTASTLPSSANWYSVTYGDGKFVAVSYNSSTAAYSTDGINWIASTLPSSAYWQFVTYGDTKFVAVTNGTRTAAYSTDGINWTASTMPRNIQWRSVTYGDGKFVAVAYNSDTAAYSTDGITWTASTTPSSAYWYSVTYGDGKFVAVAYNSDTAAYSTDGITWTASTLPSTAQWYSVTYGDGKFVAVAYNSDTAPYSESSTYLTKSGEDVTSKVSDILGVDTKADKNHTHDASALILTDAATGTKYKLAVTNGELNVVEIT